MAEIGYVPLSGRRDYLNIQFKKELMKGSIEDDFEVSRLSNRVDGELLSERKKENMKRTF